MIIDQLFTRPLFEAADPNKLIVSVTILPMSAEDDTEVKDFDLTGRFQGDARSQINQATAYLKKFLESRGINFTLFQATYQGQIVNQQNYGSMEPQNDAERELQTMANQMRNKHPGQNTTPVVKEGAADPITQFASNAHEEWRRNFDPTGTKPRIKKNSDGTEGDINVPFADLHPDWQKENLAAGRAAQHAVKHFGNNMEKAAEFIHRQWMKRNPKADYNAAQHVPYDDLSDDEKEKDRVHVRTMMRLMGHQTNESGLRKFSHKKNRFRSLHKLQNPLGEENDPKRAKLERMIYKYFGQIYDYGDDDGLNYLDRNGELWNQLMDKYDGEIEDIVAHEPTEVLMQAAQELKGIAGDMKYELDEAAQGHTIEAHGVRGMDRRTWHKTFKNTDQMIAWAEKHDAEIVGTRDLEQARHHNLSPAKAKGITEGTDDPAKDALIQALMGHSVDDPRELWVDLKEIGRGFKTPVSKQIRMALRSLSPDDAYELWDTALEIAGVTQDEIDNMTDDMDDSRDVWDGNLRGVSPPATGQKKTKHKIHKTIYIESQGVAEGVAETVSMDQAKKVLRHYGADHFKTTTNELHFYKNGRPMSVDLIFNDDATRSVNLSQLNSATRRLKGQGVAKGQQIDEMFADQGSGSTDRDNADYMKRRNAAKKKGYTGRETKAGTWRVFKDGNAVAAAGPFNSADEAAAWIKKHKQGITEMDKSQPSAGRDGGPRPGPDREAKPITAKKATKDAADMLNRAFQDSHKKKDVKEAYPLGYSTDPAQGKWYQEGMDAVKYGTVGDSIKEIAKKHFVPPQWLEAFTAGFRQQEEWSREGTARGFPGGQKPEPYTTSKAMSVPPTFQPNTNARGGGGTVMNPDPLAQLMRESGIGSEPLMKKLRRALIKEGRVKELADDLKTMSDADFMKKYGKAKAAIRKDMKRVDEAAQTNYTPQEMADILSGKKTQQQVDAERAKKIDDQTDDLVMRVDKQGRRVDKNGKLLPPPKTWTNPPINPPPGKMQQYEGLDEQDAAGQQFVGTGTSSNWQMSVDIAAMNAKRKAAQSIAGTNSFQGVQLPPGTKYGPQDTKSDGTGKYVSTYTITLPAPGQSAEPPPAAPGAALDSSPATGNMKGSMSTGAPAAVGPAAGNYMKVNELSTNKLSQYKTAAAKDAKKADQAGDFKRGDKRLGGMVQATKKQFDNDAKKVDESRAARRALMARIVNAR